MALAIERIFRESLPAPVSLVYLSSGPAILVSPFIVCQRVIRNDVLASVAIVVVCLARFAPTAIEQRNARRHASCVSRFLALGNAHQSVDGDRSLCARESLDLGDLLRPTAWIAAPALRECAWSARLILTCST